jgi:hypothetical protein
VRDLLGVLLGLCALQPETNAQPKHRAGASEIPRAGPVVTAGGLVFVLPETVER